jgi:hypothetical protein
MPTKKKTGDPVDDLLSTSRRVLENMPSDGRERIPYTVARAFVARGWGAHLGKGPTGKGTGVPMSLFQLNEQGLNAARTARQRSRSQLDDITYSAVHEATSSEITALLEVQPLSELIASAEALISRVESSGLSAAGARGYRDALAEYQASLETVPA